MDAYYLHFHEGQRYWRHWANVLQHSLKSCPARPISLTTGRNAFPQPVHKLAAPKWLPLYFCLGHNERKGHGSDSVLGYNLLIVREYGNEWNIGLWEYGNGKWQWIKYGSDYILEYNHSPLYISLRYNVHMVLSHANQFAIRLSHRMCVTMWTEVCPLSRTLLSCMSAFIHQMSSQSIHRMGIWKRFGELLGDKCVCVCIWVGCQWSIFRRWKMAYF